MCQWKLVRQCSVVELEFSLEFRILQLEEREEARTTRIR